MVIQIIGIIVALLLFLILVYKGVSSFIVAPICAIIIAVTNALNPVDTFYLFAQGVGDMIVNLFAIIFLGVVLGRLYTDTGAASSIAKTLVTKFVQHRKGNNQIWVAMLICILMSGIMTLGGIDGFVLTFTIFPIYVVVAEMCDIPRRFIPVMLMLNCAFMAAPGAPQINNIAMVGALNGAGYTEVTSTAALIPGMIGVLVIAILCYVTVSKLVIKAKGRGETFDYGGIEKIDIFDEERKLPNFWVALIPLVVVFILYTVLKLDILIALSSGIVVCLITMGWNLKKKDGSYIKAIVASLNRGADGYPHALTTISTPSGLASVVLSTAAFGAIVGFLTTVDINPILLGLLIVVVIVALTSAPPVALFAGLPIAVGILAAKGLAFDVNALGRVAAMAATTFETLPVNGMCVLTIALAKSTYKKSYFPMFMNTVVWTLVGTAVAALICIFLPGLV